MSESYNWDKGLFLSASVSHKISPEYQPLLDSGDLSKVEDLLVERIEDSPHDVAFFLPAYRAFIRRRDTERINTLLGLHVESLKARGDLSAEILLLREVLESWEGCKYARDLLIGHLRAMYVDSPNFEIHAGHLRVRDEGAGIENLRQFEIWLRYDEGRIVYLPSRGVGRVREANCRLGVVRLVLTNSGQMSLRIEEAQRLARPFPSGHFIARTVIDPGTFKRLVSDDPGEVLRMLFADVGNEISLSDMREMLSAVVPEDQWSAWWARARKDSRLIVGSGTKPAVSWSNSVSEGDSGLLTKFLSSSTRSRLEMIRKHSSRSESLSAEMSRLLAEDASNLAQSDPSLSLEILLTISGISSCKDTESCDGAVRDLLSRSDAESVIAGIEDRLIRKKAVSTVARMRDDWPRIYFRLLENESDAAILRSIYEALCEGGHNDAVDRVVNSLISDPSTNPRFFLWLCGETPRRKELSKYCDHRFVFSVLGALDSKAFRGHQAALRRLFDAGEAADLALERLDASSGRSVLDTLSRVRELEGFRKELIRRRILDLIPQLDDGRKNFMFVTKESLEKKRLEYEKIVKEEIPRNSLEIKRTREYGDLRENFEYHEARRQQELLSSRAKTLHDELTAARAIETQSIDTSKISIGTVVRLRTETGSEEHIDIAILGPWDSDPSKNILSYTSAAAAALLNAPKGSTVIFNDRRWVVDSIDKWGPESGRSSSPSSCSQMEKPAD